MKKAGLSILFASLLSACQIGGNDPVSRGRAVFAAYKCAACHTVAGEGGTLGPDLTFLGFRKNADFLERWLINPHAWKPNVSMPGFYFQENTRKDLVAYLSSLRGKGYEPGRRPWDEPDFRHDKLKRGAEIFKRAGCVTCHGKGGAGGYPNNNVVGGLIPAVNKVSEGFSRQELIEKIAKGVAKSGKADPAGPDPLLYMPRWERKLKKDEIEAAADYLLSLGAASSGEEW